MEGPSRSTGFRQSRRSRSQRDRERRRRRVDLNEQRATSLSSGSDQEACGTNGVRGPGGREGRPGFGRHRPPRRRKRESVSCEEDIIDGFAIASFVSLEALEMDCSLKPNQRSDMPGRRNKGKRGPEQNGGGPLSDPEAGGPHSVHRNKRRKMDEQGMTLETGYICDTESDSGGKASDNEIDPVFTVSTRKVVEPPVASMGSSIGKNAPQLQVRGGSVSRLMVTPRVSGLERSQEKSQEQNFPEPVTTSTSSARLPSHSSVPRPNAVNGGSSRHNANSPLSKPKPFLTLPGRSQPMYGINRSSTPVKPTSSSSSIPSSSMRPPTPSTSVSLPYMRVSSSSLPLRPPSRASAGALFTSSPGLPPPPPLLQGPSHTSAAEREGRRSVPGSENATAGRSTPASSSTPGSSSRTSQNQPSIQPLAFQFHQHNHQHQHTHTHQHFTPFQYPPAAAPPLFEKYGKMNELYRHPFFPQFPPSVPSIQPVIPPTGPFSSLQGAFQPKPLVPQGTAPDLTARLGVVPHHLQPKDPRLTDPFGTSLKISNKPGKWCAMHVYVAWMILSHQKKVKLMQADPHKLDFRSDLLARIPGAGGLGPLGPMGGSLPPTHDLTRPPTLFSGTGGVNPSTAPFITPTAPHSSFLTPSHLGGSVFGPKDSPASVVGGLSSNHHDPWSRLHGGPPGFPGPSWAKGPDKRDERDRGKDAERREVPHIKDEKDRDNMLYGRPPVRMSPVGPAFKPRSSTPVSHINGHSSALGPSSGPIEDLTRSLNRDRDREREADKRPLPTMSSRGPPVGSSTSLGDRERPRSSSSSVLTTPPPSNPSAPSPLDLYPRSLGSSAHSHHNESTHSQRDSNPPASSVASASVTALTQAKKSDRTTPVSKSSLLVPPVKVKEERKEEPEHIPITLPPPPAPNHTFDRPNSHPLHPRSGTPSSSSLTPTPGVPLPPPTPNPHLSLLDRTRAIDAYLGGAGPGGLVVGPGADRFHPGPTHGPSQGPHSFTWDPWRELAVQHQQQRREALAFRSDHHLALRSDPHLSRLLQHQRLLEAERAAAVAAAAAAPHHPPTSTSTPSSSAVRQEFSLMAHPFDRHHQLGPPGGGLIDEEQRAQILREDFERARYFGMHPHLPGSHLSSPSHAATAAHLEQLHPGLLSHPLPPGASAAHHAGLYSRLGPLNPHMANGILAKTPAGLVGALSMGAPPPLIPSVTSRSATPPRRLGAPGELALFSAHKDGESR
ncbi:autism susceptibility gene 2 protein homolog isoform X5 [Periophthalmus magnuspinnatus]|uniref:autism susceptibility gene 2 protein homolog isoform X5 n=1 Tax=Periophthalmus magnuspinnatus TaxID=409849 RepID=UPI002436E475|nr:autism susceptibility gene 2 protein homolog isoform X5 [Periophthalmus magnuspinnatus]